MPEGVPPPLARLLAACWQEDPSLRPAFQDILAVLQAPPPLPHDNLGDLLHLQWRDVPDADQVASSSSGDRPYSFAH